jgi:hypothetical protein
MVASKLRIRSDAIAIARCFLFASTVLMVPYLHADELPLDLALVDREHVGFVQIRLADLWKSESFAAVRMLVAKAGPEMVKVFDERFVHVPASADRLMMIFAADTQEANPLRDPILVVTTSQPFDRAKLIKGLLPKGLESKTGPWTRFADAERATTLCLLDPRTFAIGPTAAMDQLAVKPRGRAGKLQRAVDFAARGPSLVAALRPEFFLAAIQEMRLPQQLLAVAEAQSILVTARLSKDLRMDFRLEFADPQHAMAGQKGLRFAIDQARKQLQTARAEMESLVKGQEAGQVGSGSDRPKAAAGLLGLGVIELLDEQIVKLPLERKGIGVTMSLELPMAYNPRSRQGGNQVQAPISTEPPPPAPDWKASLNRTADLAKGMDPMPLHEAVENFRDLFQVPITINGKAFQKDLKIDDVESFRVSLPVMFGASLKEIMQRISKQVHGVCRLSGDHLEIVPWTRAFPILPLIGTVFRLEDGRRRVLAMSGH